jgi:hypothetical protein
MNVTTAKFLVLAVVTLAAGSMTVILGQSPSESGQPLQPLSAESEAPALCEVVALRATAKDYIIRDVIACRRSLIQAAALFGALNRVPPQSPRLSRADRYGSHFHLATHTDEERLCRQVGLERGAHKHGRVSPVRCLEPPSNLPNGRRPRPPHGVSLLHQRPLRKGRNLGMAMTDVKLVPAKRGLRRVPDPKRGMLRCSGQCGARNLCHA